MPAVGSLVMTLADIAKGLGPNDKIARLIEILNQQNWMLDDIAWMPCNDGTRHRTAIRTGLPQGTWRMLYQGVQPSKTSRAQVSDTCGMLENYAEPDKALVDMSGDPAGFRLSEAKGIMEGMNQQVAQALIYGNQVVTPQMFTGLSPRYNTLNPLVATSSNVIDAGGTGADNTSIWLVYWGEETCHGIYPRGSTAGLEHRDLGEDTVQLGDGSRYQAYREHFKWACGLTLRDWRYVVRIANIDVSDLLSDITKLKALITLMIRAAERIREGGSGRAAWYMTRNTRAMLRLAILERIAPQLTEETVNGRRVVMWDGAPVRIMEQMLDTEARVV